MNCYNPSISVPCNDILDEFTCTANGGQWEPWGPAPTPVPPAPGPAPTLIDPSCTAPMMCKLPYNCYYAQWAAPCSQAADMYACQASAGVWCWNWVAEHADNSTFSSDGASGWATHNLVEVV